MTRIEARRIVSNDANKIKRGYTPKARLGGAKVLVKDG